MTRNWADLPKELLGLILDRLILLPDYIRFGAVCKSWLCETRAKEQERGRGFHIQPPMLLIPPDKSVKDHRRLYSISEKKLYSNGLYIPYRTCCGSSTYGWLAFYVREECSITLLNPFSGSTIKFPPIISDLCADRISNVILSCDPFFHPDDFVVAAIFSITDVDVGDIDEAAYIRSGERSWTFISDNHSLFRITYLCFYQGYLYATDLYRSLIVVDFSQTRGKCGKMYGRSTYLAESESLINSPFCGDCFFIMAYLVELQGELLLVGRCYVDTDDDRERTLGFKVFKLNHKKPHLCDSGNTAEWVEIHSLGDFSIFLGDNESFSVCASNFSDLQPNCVYYTYDRKVMPHFDMGIFDLATKNISGYYTLEHSHISMPAPVWISPKLGPNLLS